MAFRAIMRNFQNFNLKNTSKMATGGVAKFATPRSFASAAAIDVLHNPPKSRITGSWKADLAPIYIMGGLILVASAMAAHTAKQQLLHSPAVQINKKRREGSPEVDDPDSVIGEADKFLNKSFLRKVGHIQATHDWHNDPVRANPYTKSREVESLKSVGV